MLEILRDAFMDTLTDFPWWRRTLLVAILATFWMWDSLSWQGFATWAAIFALYEIAGLVFPSKPRQ